jgi:ribonuclease R
MPKNNKKSKKSEPDVRSAKEERLFQNLLKITEQFMSGKGFMPLTESELLQRLSLPEQHEAIFKDILASLIQRGLIEFTNERYAWKQSTQDVVKGTIRMHPRGFGFVQPDDATLFSQDIFIPKHLTKNAVDGDSVEVWVNQDSVSEKGPEGKVIAILSRSRTHIAGIVRSIDIHGDIIAYAPILGTQQRIFVQPSEERVLQVGDRIVMEIVDWGAKETETVCRLSHYLGHISDPSCDISAAIEEFEIRSDFTHQVIEEARSFGTRVSAKDIQGRADFRSWEVFTIDPDTAKDFDDALSLTVDEEGYYNLGVHIADVSHYVKTGSGIDLEAQERANSTYFPGVCIPMLPSVLSDNLCSLKPNVNRLTVSVLMRFDPTGELVSHEIVRSVIKSAKRFSYREAKAVLDGKVKSVHTPTLELMVKMCGLLKHKRYQRGSIEFALPELVILVDEKGVPYGTDYVTYDITHQMVEEFMLKANEMVAWDLTQKGKNLTYRVHDVPAEDNLKDFSMVAAAFGFRLPESPTPQDLQKLFEEAGETSYVNYLASSYIRRMRLAVYSAENIGHYGLSLTHYCHFTSPIRRYVDLVVHRILFGDSDNLEYLQNIALHCSDQERISAKAESSVVTLKKLRFLDAGHKIDPHKEHEAVITRVKNFGIYFEILDLLFEGFLHIAELEEDYFVFEESRMRLRGTRKGSTYATGDRLIVMLKEVDLIALEAKWYLISKASSPIPLLSKKDAKKIKKKSKTGKTTLKKWDRKKSLGEKAKPQKRVVKPKKKKTK